MQDYIKIMRKPLFLSQKATPHLLFLFFLRKISVTPFKGGLLHQHYISNHLDHKASIKKSYLTE